MLDFKLLSKTDLHCHLDGSLPIPLLEKHLGRPISPEEVCADETCPSLTDYLKKFDIPVQCLKTAEHLEAAACSFLKQLSSDNIHYVEVRFAPMLSAHDELSCSQVIESVLKGLRTGSAQTGITFQVITCAMRHFSMEYNMQTMDAAQKYLGKGVCALDLAGDESQYPNTLFHEFFEEALHRQIPFTIHSGETGNVENIRLAMEYGASRIGHGLALIKDPDLMQEIAARQIGIEMCPTSNLQTKAAVSLAQYPLINFLDAGIKVSVNTDNRTVSCTNSTRELELLWNFYQDDSMIHQLLKNGVETAFFL